MLSCNHVKDRRLGDLGARRPSTLEQMSAIEEGPHLSVSWSECVCLSHFRLFPSDSIYSRNLVIHIAAEGFKVAAHMFVYIGF